MDANVLMSNSSPRTLPDIALGDAGWFSVLLDELVLRQSQVVLDPVVSGEPRGYQVRLALEHLWSTGALVGSPFDSRASAVTGRNDMEAAFVELLRFQLSQVATQWQRLHPAETDSARMRWFAGAVLGALAGEVAASASLEAAAFDTAHALPERDERRLLGIVGARLLRRAYLLGHPPGGLPLHAGLAWLDTRTALRLAEGRLQRGGTLRRRAPLVLSSLSQLKALWIELLAGLPELIDLGSVESRRVVERQVRASALTTPDRRVLLRALDSPRHPARILRQTPPSVRRLLVEQTVLAATLNRAWRGQLEKHVRDTAQTLGIPDDDITRAQVRAAALLVQHEGAASRLLSLHQGGEVLADAVTAATDRLGAVAAAIAQEMRETGDLGILLARLAQGEHLSSDERARAKAQLADLARIVPALAIFAAPGGMLLLPAVLKLLPFDLRPSAFRPNIKKASNEES